MRTIIFAQCEKGHLSIIFRADLENLADVTFNTSEGEQELKGCPHCGNTRILSNVVKLDDIQ